MKGCCSTMVVRLAIVVMVLPALLPSGTMLARDAGSDEVVITICSGFASRQVTLDLVSGEIRDPRGTLSALPVDGDDQDSPSTDDPIRCPLCLVADTVDVAATHFVAAAESSGTYIPAIFASAPRRSTIHHPPRGPPVTA